MKLTPKTIAVLKNFALINPGLIFKKGSLLRTKSISGAILAEATVDNEFDREFAIYDLNLFLSVLSLFDDPELKFSSKFVTINQGARSIKYHFSDNLLVVSPDENITFGDGDTTFDFSRDELEALLKAASIMQLTNIQVVGDNAGVSVNATDSTNTSANDYTTKIEGGVSEDFDVTIHVENLVAISQDYEFQIAERFISLKSEESKIQYWIAPET